jgi:hypothetical protein
MTEVNQLLMNKVTVRNLGGLIVHEVLYFVTCGYFGLGGHGKEHMKMYLVSTVFYHLLSSY